MVRVIFRAKGVASSELPEVNARAVVFAEDPDGGEGSRLEISRALTFTEQDRELGQDTYSLATQTGATVYGGVRWYTLEGTTLTVRLERRAQRALGVPQQVSIQLDVDPDTVARVGAGLASILGMGSGRR
jgi:hypothetical protein